MPAEATKQAALLKAIQTKLVKKDAQAVGLPVDDVRRYATAFVRRADINDSANLEADAVIDQALGLLRFAQTQEANSIKTRVFRSDDGQGGSTGSVILETSMKDQPFILDTLRLALEGLNIREYRCHHPILEVERDDTGTLKALGSIEGRTKESWMHFRLESLEDDTTLETLNHEAKTRLARAQVVVRDHNRMLRRVTATANDILLVAGEQPRLAEEIDEINEFLAWIRDENFIFLGFEEYEATQSADGEVQLQNTDIRLGICRDGFRGADTPRLPSASMEWLKSQGLLLVVKDDLHAQVHRSGKLDTVLIRHLDEQGELIAVRKVTGLFTRKALNQDGQNIPILSHKLKRILGEDETDMGSHHHKAMVAAFNSLPVEYLFVADIPSVNQAMRLIIDSEIRKEPQVFLRKDPNGRSAFTLMSLPRESYDEKVRVAIADKLNNALGASYQDERILFGEHENVVLSFFLTAEEKLADDVDLTDLTESLKALARTWEDKFTAVMRSTLESKDFDAFSRRYRGGLPETYRLTTSPRDAMADVLAMERLRTADALQFRVTRYGRETDTYILNIYQEQNILLTDSLPILANFGLRVIEQVSEDIPLADSDRAFIIDSFRVQAQDGASIDLEERGDDLAEALRMVLTGQMENDLLNRLLLKAGLKAREVDMLRAYINCARQIEAYFPLESTRRVWVEHPEAAQLLTRLFHVKFDPDLALPKGKDRASLLETCHAGVKAYLSGVESNAEDRVLRTVWNLADSTLRTNFFRLPTRPYISFKLDSSNVAYMPSPRPYREIYVHHPLVEGVHLRGGPIARGGLRWSDRFDDYRTEVLGLMRTQMVKNTVIVPVGSKGGFVLKTSYPNRDEQRKAADEMYKTFISGLLDITDNVVDGETVTPDGVIRYDGDDPYLVVAADKGTAHLSDTANAISQEYGFWLDDAFASGGSVGYDHKKEGITARGGWECVKRLFREVGKDPEIDVITVSGIGDMSGDVFGNGLLLSKTLKLQAAFNHMHIFFDPDPDPAASWEERKRLFGLARSTWEDYSKDLISKGGGVFRRTAKAIPLSPEVQAMLGTDAESLNGDEAVRAILKMKVDLLWNGGIGTYARASYETNRDANDRVNDPVRVTALELGAKVIGEGGNLGFTQAARVEFALNGGRLNTDFVDNSAGVDMSDHEVNLKLLFGLLVHDSAMTMKDRNVLLASLTDEVSEAVLQNNRSQSRAISLDEIRSRVDITPFLSLIDNLHTSGVAKRKAENLPSAEALEERSQQGRGLARPELATLLAFTKMRIYTWLLGDDRISGDLVKAYTFDYFPKEVRARFVETINQHPLKREITATVLTTRIVDNAGICFFQEIWEDTTFSVGEIAMAYLITAEMLGSSRLEESLAELEGTIAMNGLYRARIAIENALGNLTRRMLRRRFDVFNPDAVVGRYTADFRDLHFTLVDVLPETSLAGVVKDRDVYVDMGFPEALAQELATFPHLASGGDIAILTEESGLDIATSAWLYHAVGEEAHIRSAMELAQPSLPADRWEKTALHVIRGKLIDAQYNIALNVANRHDGEVELKETLNRYFAERQDLSHRVTSIETQIRASKGEGLAAATVLAEAIEDLALSR